MDKQRDLETENKNDAEYIMKTGFSIIICCYNSAIRLETTLHHVSQLNVPDNTDVELIVIDNGSTDDTAIIAQSIWQSLSAPFILRILSEPNSGLSNARMLGILNAEYEYLLFCDDDNWLSKNYLAEALKIIEPNPSIGMLGGFGRGFSEMEMPAWSNQFKIYGCGEQAEAIGEAKALYGAGVILRRSVFNKLKNAGYKFILSDRKRNILTSGGDYELGYAVRLAGYKLWYDNSLNFTHFLPSERFSPNYVLQFIRESTGAFNVLDTYLYFIKRKASSRLYFYFNLIYAILHHSKSLFISSLKPSRLSKDKAENLPFLFEHNYHKYRLIYSLKFFFTAEKTYKKIHRLKQKLRTSNTNDFVLAKV
ncbi:MAG TPA: glycosyltransferase [Flavipsychrobacter sp.]|nr:glycosyltransferase [Flavipsychrobacter sp.]